MKSIIILIVIFVAIITTSCSKTNDFMVEYTCYSTDAYGITTATKDHTVAQSDCDTLSEAKALDAAYSDLVVSYDSVKINRILKY